MSSYPPHALDVASSTHPTITVPSGSRVRLTGPSATGKSDLCLLVAGVLDDPKREATVRIGGIALSNIEPSARSRRIGLVPSDPYLSFTGLKPTLLGELEMVERLTGHEASKTVSQALRVTDALELSHLQYRDPFTFSGGEAVRAALAMALIKRPSLLVLDQIDDQLDAVAARLIRSATAGLLPEHAGVLETASRRRSPYESDGIAAAVWSLDTSALASGDVYLDADTFSTSVVAGPLPNASAPMVIIAGLDHCYANSGFHLGPLDLSIWPGERVALVGPNGSGKSTLLKCIGLLERPRFKRLEIEDESGSTTPSHNERKMHLWAKRAMYCFQRPEDQLYLPSVAAELAETCRRLGDVGSHDRALQIAGELGLAPHMHRSPYDLPRSLRRLVPLAAALAVAPPLLLLDEPTVGLDDEQVDKLVDHIVRLRAHCATLFVSHDFAFVAALATRRITISELTSTRATLRSRPDDR